MLLNPEVSTALADNLYGREWVSCHKLAPAVIRCISSKKNLRLSGSTPG